VTARSPLVNVNGAIQEMPAGDSPLGRVWFKIAETDVGGTPPANFDIQSIPATYQHLYVVCSLRSDVAATSDTISFAFNNDTTDANYDRESLRANTNTASATEILLSRRNGSTAGASSPAGHTGVNEIFIANYAQTTLFKVARVSAVSWLARTTGGMIVQDGLVGWASTAAINRVTLAPVSGTHWAAGSTISVYGIAAGA
jgi:hypothetical protein